VLKKIKILFLWLVKLSGIFYICRYYYRFHVRVLCYHGFAYSDEFKFRPKLFMKPETFASRIEYFMKSGFKIVPLAEALNNPTKPYQLAFTMDDGWSGVYDLIKDVIVKYDIPTTIYITSYYAETQKPVMNVAVSYLLWKSKERILKLKKDNITIKEVDVVHTPERVKEICDHIDSFDSDKRLALLLDIAGQLNVSIFHNGKMLFRLLNKFELMELNRKNFDLQLHTHRHHSPLNHQEFKNEIELNRTWLSQFKSPDQLIHFCFPNGEYHMSNLEVLAAANVKSATTTRIGLHRPGSNLLKINRILDGENLSFIELEAELSGFNTFIKFLKGDRS